MSEFLLRGHQHTEQVDRFASGLIQLRAEVREAQLRAEAAARIADLKAQADAWFDTEGVAMTNRRTDIVLDARYVGQNFELAIGLGKADPLPPAAEVRQRFFAEHERAYGFHNPADPIEIVNFRLIAVGKLRPRLVERPLDQL